MNTFPVIECGALPEFCVDGIFRIDAVGSMVHIYYFQFAKDPHINGGEIYRAPVLKHIRARDTLIANAGSVREWLESGSEPGLVLPPALRKRGDVM